MFFSKLWMVLVTFAGILALGALLVATRPAEYYLRQSYRGEGMLIDMAQVAFDAELSRESRAVLDQMGSIRLDKRIIEAAENRKDTEKLIPVLQAFAKQVGFMELILSDPTGAVLANSAKGRPSVAGLTPFKEAVQGFHSDNTTFLDNQLIQVFAVPVLSKDYKKVSGVLVALRKFDTDFLTAIQDQLGHSKLDDFDVEIAIFMNNELKYATAKHDIWSQVPAYYQKVASDVRNPEKGFSPSVTLVDKKQEYQVILGQLRGAVTNPLMEPPPPSKKQDTKEKSQDTPKDAANNNESQKTTKAKKGLNSGIEDDSGVYYAIAWKLPPPLGSFSFMDKRIPQEELMRDFPWGMLIGVGVGIFMIGMLIIVLEGDLPLRRLIRRTREITAGDILLINDQEFHGRFSSLARAINEAIEKTAERGGGTSLQDKSIGDILGTGGATPSISGPGLKDGGPPPPPVAGKPLVYPKIKNVELPGQKVSAPLPEKSVLSAAVPPLPTTSAPPPLPGQTVPTEKNAPNTKKSSGNIVLPPAPGENADEYFQHVLQQFKELKQKLEGSLDGFDETDFLKKLEQSTADVREKMKCERVILTVYEREGKAGLKAAPYRGQ